MTQLLLSNYLTIRSRKMQNLITKRNNIYIWLFPLVIQVYNNKDHHMRLQVRSENLNSRQNIVSESITVLYVEYKKDFPKRSSNIKQFPSSKPASSSTKFWKPTLSTAYLTTPRFSSGRKIGPLSVIMGRVNSKQMSSLSSGKVSGYHSIRPTPPPPQTLSIFWIKKSKRKVQGVPQSQSAALPRPQEEEETAFWSTAAHLAFCFTVVLRVASGHSVKMAGHKSALNPILLTVLRRCSRY